MPPKSKDKDAPKEKVDPGVVARSYENPTPAGELKSMDEPMASSYKPHIVEAAWDSWWQESGYYRAESSPEDKRPKFSICLPPPNVTGSLHLGHALTVAVQDLLCRWHRMRGFNVLWIPGTDHAGIATQVVVEKKLWKERQQTRHDLGRENFVKEVYVWKDQYGANIFRQLRRLGCSLGERGRRGRTDPSLPAANLPAATSPRPPNHHRYPHSLCHGTACVQADQCLPFPHACCTAIAVVQTGLARSSRWTSHAPRR